MSELKVRKLLDEDGCLVEVFDADETIRYIAHNKRKRCLAMARWCEMSRRELDTRACLPTTQNWNRHEEWLYFVNYWSRYESKFKALAEKFKEAK